MQLLLAPRWVAGINVGTQFRAFLHTPEIFATDFNCRTFIPSPERTLVAIIASIALMQLRLLPPLDALMNSLRRVCLAGGRLIQLR